jgi:imidazolonepropionase-like amidohydrolase
MGFRLPQNQARRRDRMKIQFVLSMIIISALYLHFSLLPQYVFRARPSSLQIDYLETALQKCAELNKPPVQYTFPVPSTRTNPRWGSPSRQNETILLRNATLFDGEAFLLDTVDILFTNGVIKTVSSASSTDTEINSAKVLELNGKYVTPGLIDMHSHHLVISWPTLLATDDVNEVNPAFGPLSPFVRVADAIKPYDIATTIIASGGVTSSLILPGSANIMGGEGILVKNILRSGSHGEEVVEELLLEHGVPKSERRRYIKMACGENPRAIYGHTRMGNAWMFRKHMTRAKEMREKRDAWCLAAVAARRSNDASAISALRSEEIDLLEAVEMDSTIAMLRGKIGVNVHCYEEEDFEDMIGHSKEFGFRIQAFHHAHDAWKVPEMIKDSGQ